MISGIVEIRGLKLRTFIGVPDDERAASQELKVTVKMTPATSFRAMDDEIGRTVDYAAVAAGLASLALARPRRLIETVAADIADYILDHYPVTFVEVSVEKYILPDTECVAVHLARERHGAN